MMEGFGSWSVLTTNFLIILYIALGGVTLASVLHLCNGQWRFQVRFLAVTSAALFPIAGIMLIILLVNGTDTFQWLAQAHEAGGHGHDAEHPLVAWHNYTFLVTRQILGFLLVSGFFGLFIKLQYQTSVDSSYQAQRRFRNVALLIPVAYFLYGTMVAWDFEMTMIPGWHSASYGAYQFQSGFHMFLAAFTIFLFFMRRSGALTKPITDHVMNFLAQFILAMTILWTYLYFTQYLIMWYGRLPHDMDRYHSMMSEGYGTLWWTFLTLKFIIPFCTLAITPNRHNPVTITFVAICIVIGTWIERYTWVSGSVDSRYYHTPMTQMFDIVVTITVLVTAWVSVKWALNKYGLIQGRGV